MNTGRMRDLARAVAILQRRGIIDPLRPWQAVAASRAMRRWGTFGGLAVHVARRYGDAPAVEDDDGTITFRQLDQQSNALGRVLEREVGSGATLGLLARNHRGFLVGLAAADKIGARIVLLNTGFGPRQLCEVCAREGVAAILADEEFESASAALPEGVAVLGEARMAALIASSDSSPLPPPRAHGGLVLLTSGTTGTPKGAPRDKISPIQSAQLLDRVPWSAGGTYCIAAPLFHATGLATCTVALALGNRVLLSRRFDPERAAASMARRGAEVLVLVPTMLSRLLAQRPDAASAYDLSALRVVFVAGSALSPGLCRRTAAEFGDVLYNLYGSTEVATAAVATPDELRRAPGTVGRPPVGCTLAVYDSAGSRITRPGEVGTVYVSSGLSFAGYTGGGGKKVIDGLLSSGDTGHFDREGLWYIDGRDDDMVVSGGENVFPLEVENALAEHPAVVEVAVIGVDDDDFGKRLRAYVVAAPGRTVDADELRDLVRTDLARHKVPRDVVFLDALPRNETGKVLKNRLAEVGADSARDHV